MIDTTKSISKVTYDGTNMSLATQTKTVTPTTSEQVIVGDDGYNLSSVTVEAVTKDIDTNIQNETGVKYSEAVDVPNRYTYTESNEDIEIEKTEEIEDNLNNLS